MALTFFNPASLLPSPEVAVKPPPVDTSGSFFLSEALKQVTDVVKQKRDVDDLKKQAEYYAEYFDKEDPQVATLLRSKASGYNLGTDTNAERSSLLSGAINLSKLEIERNKNEGLVAVNDLTGKKLSAQQAILSEIVKMSDDEERTNRDIFTQQDAAWNKAKDSGVDPGPRPAMKENKYAPQVQRKIQEIDTMAKETPDQSPKKVSAASFTAAPIVGAGNGGADWEKPPLPDGVTGVGPDITLLQPYPDVTPQPDSDTLENPESPSVPQLNEDSKSEIVQKAMEQRKVAEEQKAIKIEKIKTAASSIDSKIQLVNTDKSQYNSEASRLNVATAYKNAKDAISKIPMNLSYEEIDKRITKIVNDADEIQRMADKATTTKNTDDIPIVKVNMPGGGTIQAKITDNGAGVETAMTKQNGFWKTDLNLTNLMKEGKATIDGGSTSVTPTTTAAPAAGGNQGALDLLEALKKMNKK